MWISPDCTEPMMGRGIYTKTAPAPPLQAPLPPAPGGGRWGGGAIVLCHAKIMTFKKVLTLATEKRRKEIFSHIISSKNPFISKDLDSIQKVENS